jgi:ferritin
MIKQSVQDAINSQIAKEMYSSNLYLSMASFYSGMNLNGFANWMRVQAQEELFHAMKFFDYLLERGGSVVIANIDAPPVTWKSALDAFEFAYHHEQTVTESINNLASLAIKESDHATNILLQWFITEQVEEESTASDVVERLKMLGDFKGGLLMMDGELKTRVFVQPPANKA